MPGSIVLHPRPESFESVNIIKGVARVKEHTNKRADKRKINVFKLFSP